jgi:hypothetical protein
MDDEDIKHWQHLIEEHKRYLRVREEQATNYGSLSCPPHIILEIKSAKRQIGELQQRIRRRIRNAENDRFYSAEEIDEVSDKIARIAELEQVIPMREGLIEILRDTFYWRNQSPKGRIVVCGLAVIVFYPLLRVILEIIYSNHGEYLWSIILGFFATLVYVFVVFSLYRWFKQIYSNVRDLEKKQEDDKEELQILRSELSEIYAIKDKQKVP